MDQNRMIYLLWMGIGLRLPIKSTGLSGWNGTSGLHVTWTEIKLFCTK